MGNTSFFGLDFGTSNSTFSMHHNDKRCLLPLEGENATLPSVIFFNFENAQQSYGRAAMAEYLDGIDGRLMRSLKSVLGSSLMQNETKINQKYLPFTEIIGSFIGHIKNQAEQAAGQTIDTVVLGRPVHFVDFDKKADSTAQNQLEAIARTQGFKHIAFQYEPIAAALDYEQDITQEEIALIVDMGGGTSDFSVVRLSPERRLQHDRSQDVLANQGIHIGGTDFDKALSLREIMPHLGYGSPLQKSNLTTPKHIFHDLATWHKINLLYTQATLRLLKELHSSVESPHLIERLTQVITERQGHRIAITVEKAKIALSNNDNHPLDLEYIEKTLSPMASQQQLNDAIAGDVEKIITTIQKTVSTAGLQCSDVHTLFLTGGSTLIPAVHMAITQLFPTATITCGDTFGSVGLGLAVDAKRKFS